MFNPRAAIRPPVNPDDPDSTARDVQRMMPELFREVGNRVMVANNQGAAGGGNESDSSSEEEDGGDESNSSSEEEEEEQFSLFTGERPSAFVPGDKYVQKLEWHLSDNVRGKIRAAQEAHVAKCKRLDFGVVEHRVLRKEAIKRAKMSPDAIMQLGFQMAYHSIYNEFVPTYESCSTAAFRKGRTECIRSATEATREAVLALENADTAAKDQLLGLIRNCSDVHMKLGKEASMGQGFDRHLFGLEHTAERLGHSIPALFTDPVHQRMNHFVLSTSTLSTDTIYFGGFGPVVDDGFGLGYNVTDEKLGAVAISNKDKRNSKELCTALEASLDKIRHVIEASS